MADRRVGRWLLSVDRRTSGVTRLLQRAGTGPRPLSYRRGFCLRLPRGRMLLVVKMAGADRPWSRDAVVVDRMLAAMRDRHLIASQEPEVVGLIVLRHVRPDALTGRLRLAAWTAQALLTGHRPTWGGVSRG